MKEQQITRRNEQMRRKQLLFFILTILMSVIFVSGCGKKEEIDLNEYVRESVRGIDGETEIYLQLDITKLAQQLGKHANKKFYSQFADELEEYKIEYTVICNLLQGDPEDKDDDFLEFKKNHFDELSNGDEFSVQWENNEENIKELEKYFDVKLVYDEFIYKVKDRPAPVEEVDVFTETFLRDDGEEIPYYELETIIDETGERQWWLSLLIRGEEGYAFYCVSEIEVDTLGHEGEWEIGDQVQVTITASEEELKEQCGIILKKKTGMVTITSVGEEE